MSISYHDILTSNHFVTKAQAKAEIEEHSESFAEFVEYAGDFEEYPAETVIYWLGY